jgi:hypothetical protein
MTSNGKRPEFSWAMRHRSLAVWTPAVRLAVVHAGVYDDGRPWHHILPVLGVQTTVRHRYRRRRDRLPGL